MTQSLEFTQATVQSQQPENFQSLAVIWARKYYLSLAANQEQGQTQPEQNLTETTSIDELCSDMSMNTNLTKSQQLLLHWHTKLGHMDFHAVQAMARHDNTMPKEISTCKVPLCQACAFGKAKRRAIKNPKVVGGNKTLSPGELCATDQMEAGIGGYMYTKRGPRSSRRYHIATFFLDIATHHLFLNFQETTSAAETIKGKQRYEAFLHKFNQTVQEYRCDNGVFTSAAFTREVDTQGQRQGVAGVGAHHQNRPVEHSIGTITNWT